ncbi:phage holin family protein, partial [Escherichia coli]|nr:phage holin family protein [Escherichia coli]
MSIVMAGLRIAYFGGGGGWKRKTLEILLCGALTLTFASALEYVGYRCQQAWGLKLPTLRQRLFRCVSIRENDDGTYAITAVQHVPEKEAIVDNGAHFDGDQSGTVNGVTPPAVQHLTAEVTADSGEYQVLARWDTPKVVKGVSFLLRLTVAADDGSERLVSTARTTETTY